MSTWIIMCPKDWLPIVEIRSIAFLKDESILEGSSQTSLEELYRSGYVIRKILV